MTQIGTIELIAKIDTSQYKKGAREVDDANKQMENSAETSSKKSSGAMMAVAKVGLAAVASAAIAVGAIIISNFDNAIKRVDTLKNSARTFENMGFSADIVKRSMSALEKSIKGLPTSLDEAVRGVQMISASTNDLGKSQKIFSALNNAIIGFGGTSADVTNSVLQLSQAFAGGRIDAQTWNSMLNSGLAPALTAIARTMGITTKALKDGLSDGTISVEQFQDALIGMNEKGGAGMQSFQKISQDATKGIGTGWQNLNTAVTRGIAKVIEAIGSEKISQGITNFGTVLEKALTQVGNGAAIAVTQIETLGTALSQSGATSKVSSLASTIQSLYNTVANSTAMIILGNFIQQVFVPAIMAINAAITQNVLPALGQLYLAFIKVWNALNPALITALQILGSILGGLVLVSVWAVLSAVNLMWQILAIGISVIANVIGWIANLINWFGNLAGAIINLFSGIPGFFASVFSSAFNAVVSIFSGLRGYFSNLWSSIVSLFSSVGTSVGNAIGNSFRSVVNQVISRAVSIINGFINSINSVVGVIQKIPGVGGKVSSLSTLGVPALATGGIVTAPTLAMVGEGREAEAVIPLSKLDQMLNNGGESSTGDTYYITLDMKGIMARSRSELRDIGKDLIKAVNEEITAKGGQPIGGVSI